MSETALLDGASARQRPPPIFGLIGAVAWRNLWRNRRRTLLLAGSVGFAVALLSFVMALQTGTYTTVVDNATRLLDGHLQVQRRGYLDDPRVENTIQGVTARLATIRAIPGVVTATPRLAAFVLVSGDDRGYGAQLLGVDASGERASSTLPDMVAEGRYLDRGNEAYAGKILAQNVGANVGDQIVILGTTVTGGVAALAVTLVGTFSSGTTELDRQLIEVPYGTVADAFELHDAAHAIVVRATSVARSDSVADALQPHLPTDEVAVKWSALMPDVQQSIFLDRAIGNVMYGVLAAIVSIGVLNGFLLTVFERTREFGMLLALGMRPAALIGMLGLEAAMLASLGCAAGIAISVPLVLWSGHVGIPIGEAGELARVYHLTDRLHPALAASVLLKPTILMIVCTQLAGCLPALRVRHIRPLEALRAT